MLARWLKMITTNQQMQYTIEEPMIFNLHRQRPPKKRSTGARACHGHCDAQGREPQTRKSAMLRDEEPEALSNTNRISLGFDWDSIEIRPIQLNGDRTSIESDSYSNEFSEWMFHYMSHSTYIRTMWVESRPNSTEIRLRIDSPSRFSAESQSNLSRIRPKTIKKR